MIGIVPIPAFRDNYFWLLRRENRAWVVDPGDAGPVSEYLSANGLRLEGILLTHWHPDHIGGVDELRTETGAMVVGPEAERERMPAMDRELADGDDIEVLGENYAVMAVPGHTLGHIAYAGPGRLFCGDTLFHTGCGRLFEGTPEQMQRSLARIRAMPDETLLYCAHEYTLANLAFARGLEPGHETLARAEAEAHAARAAGQPTVPMRLDQQRASNPFLRWDDPALAAVAADHGAEPGDEVSVFATLRRLKDNA